MDKVAPVTKRPSSRETILEAAEQLAGEVGVNRLTLDAVAARAGVSKGGLLYNFPTKDALLRGMIQRFVERVRVTCGEGKSGADLMREMIAKRLEAHNPGKEKRAVSMIAAIAESPDMLDPVRCLNQSVWEKLRASPDRDSALMAWLALEGLLFMELFGSSPLSAEDRTHAVEQIQKLLER